MISRLRWPASIIATIAVLMYAAIPVGATDLDPGRPRPTVINPFPTPSLPPRVFVSMGDSLTEGIDPATKGTTYASYRLELSRLMSMTGQPYTWVVQGVGGTKCSYWAARMTTVLNTYHPDGVFLDCGTNDTPTDNTRGDYQTIINAVNAYNSLGHNTLLVASLIGVPDMKSDTNKVRPYIIDWMLNTNLAIASVVDPCFPASSCPVVPYASMWHVPADAVEWLYWDGIHLTKRAEDAYGQLFFRAAASRMGWLTIEAMRAQPMCGLNGVFRTSDPRPIPDNTIYRICTLS